MTRTRLLFGTVLGLAAISTTIVLLRDDGERAHAQDAVPVSQAGNRQAPRQLPAAENPWTAPAEPTRLATLYTRFETLTTADGLPSDRITSVVAEGDDLYVGTDRGLAIRRGGEWTIIGTEQGLSHRVITSVARDPASDTTWVSTLRGVTRIVGGRCTVFTQLTSGLMNDVVYHVVSDGPLVWCGTAAGLSVLDTKSGSWTIYDTANSIMHEPWCYTIALGPQRAWIGLWGGALVELDRRTGAWREYRDPDGEMEIDLMKDDGPIHEVTSFAAYHEGLLWQGTYFGLSRYDGRHWRSFTKADAGLPGDFISHVAARGRTCWIGSDEGLGVMEDDTVVSYVAQPDGTCLVIVTIAGTETERRTLASAPGDNYILWTQPRESDVWIATGHGLSHGFATSD